MSTYDDASLILIPSGVKDGKLYSAKPIPTYGSELVDGGDMSNAADWNINANWSVTGGLATANGTSSADINQADNLPVVGKTYRVTYTITAYTSGQFKVAYGGVSTPLKNTIGTHVDDVVATSTDRVRLGGVLPFGSVDNLSVKEVIGSGDFTFTRASEASRVNSAGLIEKVRTNSLLNTDTFSSWGLESGTLTSGFIAPDGSSTAYKYVQASGGLYSGSMFSDSLVKSLSIYLKSVDGTSYNVTLHNGVNGVSSVANVTPTWQRFSLLNTASPTSMSLYVYSIGNVGGVLVWHPQGEYGTVATDYIATTTVAVSEGSVANMPRLDYGGGATCPSLLLEPQRTNLLPNSESFTASNWNLGFATTTANQSVSPDGYTNADLLKEDSTTNFHRLFDAGISVTASAIYTSSVFVKVASGTRNFIINFGGGYGEQSVVFNVISGTIVQENSATGTITPYGNGWYRCTATATNGLVTNLNAIYYLADGVNTSYLGNNTSGVYVYGAQVELGSYPTSYIPTYGTAVTRSEDVCGATGISSVIGQTQGVIFMDFIWNNSSPTGGDYALMVYGVNTADFVSLNANGNANQMLVYAGGSAVAAIGGGNFVIGQRYKIALVYSNNYFAYYINGVLKGTDTSGAVPTNLQSVRTETPFGLKTSSQKTKQLAFFPTALTDAECITLTTL